MGSAPSWGGAKGPLTPPRHQISAWLLQQKELTVLMLPLSPPQPWLLGTFLGGRRMIMGTRHEAQMLRSPFGTMVRDRWRGWQAQLCVVPNGAGVSRAWGTRCLLWPWVSLSLGRVWGSPVPAMESLRLEGPSEPSCPRLTAADAQLLEPAWLLGWGCLSQRTQQCF